MLLNVAFPRLRLVAFLLFTFIGQVLLGSTFDVSETSPDLEPGTHWAAFSLGDDHIWSAAVGAENYYSSGETYIYRTIDGGSNWERYSVGHDKQPLGLHFFNSEEGVLYSEGVFSRTSDGGLTWTHSDLAAEGAGSFMFVLNESHIWIFSQVSSMRTTDGGTTWSELPALYTWSPAINFVDENTGFASHSLAGEGERLSSLSSRLVSKTVDGGQSWTDLQFPYSRPSGLFFFSKDVGFVCAEESNSSSSGRHRSIYKTIDGGETWVKSLFEEEIFGRIYFANNSLGFVFGEKIFRTVDGGVTWDVVHEYPYVTIGEKHTEDFPTLHNGGYLGTPLSNTLKGAVVGQRNFILRTQDAGATWREEYIGFPGITRGWGDAFNPNYNPQFGFLSEQEGYGIFEAYPSPWALYHTKNGGQSWRLVDLHDWNKYGNRVSGFSIADDGTGWAWGESGMWKKEAESEIWIPYEIGMNMYVFRIQFEDNLNGWASVGDWDERTTVRTNNGGESWERVIFEGGHPDDSFRNAFYSNGALRWVIVDVEGYYGSNHIFSTEDDGESWVNQSNLLTEGMDYTLLTLYRLDENNTGLFISGRNEQTREPETKWYRNEDGKVEWEEISANDASPIGIIHYINDCHALQFRNDALLASYDGGATWVDLEGFSDYYSVDFVGNNMAYVEGYNTNDLRKVEFKYTAETLVGTYPTSVEAAFPVTINFDTEVGSDYMIEYSDDMINWNRLCESRFTATEISKSWTENSWEIEDPTNASRFYRVWKFDTQ